MRVEGKRERENRVHIRSARRQFRGPFAIPRRRGKGLRSRRGGNGAVNPSGKTNYGDVRIRAIYYSVPGPMTHVNRRRDLSDARFRARGSSPAIRYCFLSLCRRQLFDIDSIPRDSATNRGYIRLNASRPMSLPLFVYSEQFAYGGNLTSRFSVNIDGPIYSLA